MKTKRIGILGTGMVGEALGTGFVAEGCEVKMGSRDPASLKAQAWVKAAGPRASVGSFAEAAGFGEIVVLATHWSGVENALNLAGPSAIADKIVIDVTNPLGNDRNKLELVVGLDDSAGERVQRWLPRARVVKAFNTVGAPLMVKPQLPGGPPDMMIAGNDAAAKQTVEEIVRAFGWGCIDLGGIEAARLLEPMCMVWIAYGIRGNGWNHAFKMLRG